MGTKRRAARVRVLNRDGLLRQIFAIQALSVVAPEAVKTQQVLLGGAKVTIRISPSSPATQDLPGLDQLLNQPRRRQAYRKAAGVMRRAIKNLQLMLRHPLQPGPQFDQFGGAQLFPGSGIRPSSHGESQGTIFSICSPVATWQ